MVVPKHRPTLPYQIAGATARRIVPFGTVPGRWRSHDADGHPVSDLLFVFPVMFKQYRTSTLISRHPPVAVYFHLWHPRPYDGSKPSSCWRSSRSDSCRRPAGFIRKFILPSTRCCTPSFRCPYSTPQYSAVMVRVDSVNYFL